jgi:HlyD family secretion protein
MADSRIHRTYPSFAAFSAVLALFVFTAACDEALPDAFGNFEANEVAVSAEFAGILLRLDAVEGQYLEAGAVAAELDTLQLSLQRAELEAQRESARLRAAEARAQVRVLEAQLETARDDLARTERLYAAEASTAQELSRFGGTVRVFEEQVAAAGARVRVANQEAAAVDTRIVQIEDRLGRGRIRNPIAGTVLTRFVEEGEFVQPGQPLYTIAGLDTLTLRAYVSGDQLSRVQLGSLVEVHADLDPTQLQSLPGRVSWISSEAEFTPTPIQTREERVDQVYAVKVRVANPDGLLKVGMPGELVLVGATEAQR